MKSLGIFMLGIASLIGAGSLFYHYVVLPQQDIRAIRNVVAPTPQQQQAQAQREAQSEKALNDYFACQASMLTNPKIEAWLVKQCPSENMDLIKQMDCRGKAAQSPEYARQFECTRPF